MTEIKTTTTMTAEFVREQVADLDREREDLDRKRAANDQQRAVLREVLRVLERESPAVLPPGSGSASLAVGTTSPEGSPLLVDQVLELLRASGPLARRPLVGAFSGIKAGTVDSAVYRLIRRGRVEKRGSLFAVAQSQLPAPGSGDEVLGSRSSTPLSQSDRSSAPIDHGLEGPEVHAPADGGAVASPEAGALGAADVVPDGDDPGFIRARVFAALADGRPRARPDLVRRFFGRGPDREPG